MFQCEAKSSAVWRLWKAVRQSSRLTALCACAGLTARRAAAEFLVEHGWVDDGGPKILFQGV